MSEGQNLVAWTGSNTSPSVIVEAQPVVKTIYSWDAVNKRWLLYDRSVPGYVNSLKTLRSGSAYWFLATGNGTIE